MVDTEGPKVGAVLLPQPSVKLQRKHQADVQKIKTDTLKVVFSQHYLDVNFFVTLNDSCEMAVVATESSGYQQETPQAVSLW